MVDHAEAPPLPAGSPFASWAQARRYAGPLPFTFAYHAPERQVVIVEGRREDWVPRPVRVVEALVPFLAQLSAEPLTLASAFVTENIPYHWQKGRAEQWNG
ncbi:hypothetical protein [Hymenobacter edaphi]|uniref:hypothetical protein n=1 Tax=Hymenobacter edaphi TaxID=2211146 RepID=UPI001FB2B6D5|nr:hypothetical protein [Hymenobacter edaphi]